MIWESCYWKRDLLRDADILTRWSTKKHSIKREVLFEKKIFISAHSIRKLLEAGKIDSNIKCWNVKLKRYERINRDKKITFLNNHRLEEFYGSDKTKNEGISLKRLCDYLIHSYVFNLCINDEDRVVGFFFASDAKKEECLYCIELDNFIEMLKTIGLCDIVKSCFTKDEKQPLGYKIFNEYIYYNQL